MSNARVRGGEWWGVWRVRVRWAGRTGNVVGRLYQTVALVVGHVWWQPCRQCLLKRWHVTLSCCVVHSSRECNYFRGVGIRLDRLITHGVNVTVSRDEGRDMEVRCRKGEASDALQAYGTPFGGSNYQSLQNEFFLDTYPSV